MENEDALDVYHALCEVSWEIFDGLSYIQHEPLSPVPRVRRFYGDGPVGIAFHYTGGPSGLKSLRWFNDERWGNTGSSAHVLIFDRVVDGFIGEVWASISKDLRALFPVPTLILADWEMGTWCTNWANGYTLGVENRNVGYKSRYLDRLGKEPVVFGDHNWEPYTREQLICNINIGRVLNGYTSFSLDPNWIVGHSMMNAAKVDPGPLFPMHQIREAIFEDSPPVDYDWLWSNPLAPDTDDEMKMWWEVSNDYRGDSHSGEILEAKEDSVLEGEDPVFVSTALYMMGYNCNEDIEVYRLEDLKLFIEWFQRSTRYYKKINRSKDVLKITGKADYKTTSALRLRLKELSLI